MFVDHQDHQTICWFFSPLSHQIVRENWIRRENKHVMHLSNSNKYQTAILIHFYFVERKPKFIKYVLGHRKKKPKGITNLLNWSLTQPPPLDIFPNKSCILEKLNLLTCEDSSTNSINNEKLNISIYIYKYCKSVTCVTHHLSPRPTATALDFSRTGVLITTVSA